MYDYTNNNWSHWNSNEKLKEKFGSCTRKTFDKVQKTFVIPQQAKYRKHLPFRCRQVIGSTCHCAVGRYRKHLSFRSRQGTVNTCQSTLCHVKTIYITPQFLFRISFFPEILLIPKYLCLRTIFWSCFDVNILMQTRSSSADCEKVRTVKVSEKNIVFG